MTTEDISTLLGRKASELMKDQILKPTNPSTYIESMRHSLAAWLLVEATDDQILAIWEVNRPSPNRN